MPDFPITLNGRTYDLMVTEDGEPYCPLADWPATLPGLIAAREAEIAALRAELARARAWAPDDDPRPRCSYCGAHRDDGRPLTMHELRCARNPHRQLSGGGATFGQAGDGKRLQAHLQREKHACPGCGHALGKNNWARHVAKCTGRPAPPWPGSPPPLDDAPPPATAALARTIGRPAAPAEEGPGPKAGAPS